MNSGNRAGGLTPRSGCFICKRAALILEGHFPDLVGHMMRGAACIGILGKQAASLLKCSGQGPARASSCDYNRDVLRQHHVNHSTSVCLHLKASQRTQCRWKPV